MATLSNKDKVFIQTALESGTRDTAYQAFAGRKGAFNMFFGGKVTKHKSACMRAAWKHICAVHSQSIQSLV